MPVGTTTIGLIDRRRLKRKAKRVYNRLAAIAPDANAAVNDVENSFNLVIQSICVLALSLGLFLLINSPATRTVLPQVAEFDTALKMLISVGLGIVLTFVFFFRVLSHYSRYVFESASGFLLLWIKVTNSPLRHRYYEYVNNWVRTQPGAVIDAVTHCYGQPTPGVLPQRIVKALEALRTGGKTTPALVLRGTLERKYWFLYLGSGLNSPRPDTPAHLKSYYRKAREMRNTIKVAMVLDALGAQLRDEVIPSDGWRRDYVTRKRIQHDSLFDADDVPLRFRTGAPHYGWPDVKSNKSIAETALYRCFTCVENPSGMALQVLPVATVIGKFPAVIEDFFEDCRPTHPHAAENQARRLSEVLAGLQTTGVRIYGKWKKETLQPLVAYDASNQPVLKDLTSLGKTESLREGPKPSTAGLEGDWGMKWDPNRLSMNSLLDDGRTRPPFAVLIEAIDRARAEVKPVILKRGDLLIVDNMRCLVSRYEIDPDEQPTWQDILGLKQEWWLTGYYGFRKAKATTT